MKIEPGACVILCLHSPREKIWGILVAIDSAGVQIRGVDLNSFDDWVNAISYGERNIGLTYTFMPMWRVERIMLDESLGDIISLEEQFAIRIGFSLSDYLSGKSDEMVS